MNLPEAPRVIYERNPLTEVISQVRFPSILRIEAELPAGFQDRIRQQLPVYKEAASELLPAGLVLPAEFADLMKNAGTRRERSFGSEDGRWTVTLAKDFLALTTAKYSRWEDFRGYLDGALNALQAEYQPAYFSRIGLRYRNVIRRSQLGLDGVGWDVLLRNHLAGELTAPEIAPHVESAVRQTVVRLSQYDGKVGLRHGLTAENGEACYFVDNDFYRDTRTDVADVATILQFFSRQAHFLFRWCIDEQLHDAMGPKLLG